ALHDLALLHGNLGRPRQRQVVCEKPRSLYDRLFREHPDVLAYRHGLAIIDVQLAGAFAQLGEHARAATTTEEAVALAPGEAVALYNGACAYCGCAEAARKDVQLPAAEREALAQRYCERAIALLKAADSEGKFFKTPKQFHLLETDSELDPLRQRDDFKRFHEELKARLENQ